jgi:hypothetical protein
MQVLRAARNASATHLPTLRSRSLAISGSPSGGLGKGREPQIILKTDERNLVFEFGARGNSSSSQALDDNRVFLENDKLDVAVKSGRLVVAHLPAIALSTSTPK